MPRTAPTLDSKIRRLESIAEAADRLAVSTKTVRRWITLGRLTGYRAGGTLIRVDVDEVDSMLTPIPSASA